MSDDAPQFSERDIKMAALGLELRLGIRWMARGIACVLIIPLLFLFGPRNYFWLLALLFGLSGVAYFALGLRRKRMADRGLLAIAAEESKVN